MTGGTVCHAHGGRAPQVKAAAARRAQQARLASMLTAAIGEHQELLGRRSELVAQLLHGPRSGGLTPAETTLLYPQQLEP